MRINTVRIAIGVALAGPVAGCQSEGRNIPFMTIQQANLFPASQVPRIFRDPAIHTATHTTFMRRTE